MTSAAERVADAYDRIAATDQPEVWITLRGVDDALADAADVDRRVSRGEHLPLAGMTLAVKDNIDVAALPTSAGCPAYAYEPAVDATATARCRAAGAVILGKTNLDQFATGLVGTRSPYGPVRDVRRPDRVAGGSSSGSAVAVALGIADLALGTDTAGSGRVPAAFQGIVGVKPTRGIVSTRGVVPACRSFDCVSIFGANIRQALTALDVLTWRGRHDPADRPWPSDAPLGAPPAPRIGIAPASSLAALSDESMHALTETVTRLSELADVEIVEVDIEPLLAAGSLLYDGAFVAERYAAVGEFVATHRTEVDPIVAEIILRGGLITAADYVADQEQLDAYRMATEQSLAGCDAILLPTTPFQPTIDEVTRDPLGVNTRLGLYTTFCNLLDMCAITLPAGIADDGHFGVSLLGPAFHDHLLADLALSISGEACTPATLQPAAGLKLLVVGAHMRGQPLNHELTTRGARFLRRVKTAPSYRLYRLKTDPPKPALVRTNGAGGASIDGELWELPRAGLATLLSELPQPMVLGRVSLETGTEATGFLCEPAALANADEITAFGGWIPYRENETS